ncbi:hypothetical protein C8Q80DRAFT_1272999 [Daedaleopsis nitida]|nr:hypothetical protein C8Q80DRAFT_1272999 [Daedaleopsis nitida]
MSSSEADEIIEYVQQIIPYQFCLLSGTAMLVYDIVLTFGKEVDVIWSRKPKTAGILHVVNRYTQLAAYVAPSNVSDKAAQQTCSAVGLFEAITTVIPYVAWAAFSGLRIYALSDCNIILSAVVFALSALYIVPDIYEDAHSSFVNLPPPYGCYQAPDINGVSIPRYVYAVPYSTVCYVTGSSGCDRLRAYAEMSSRTALVLWATRAALLLGETIVLAWTLRKTSWGTARSMRTLGQRRTLMEVLLSNGVACFAVPLALNATTLALDIVGTDIALNVSQCVVCFRDALTTILISRFLLDLGAFGTPRQEDRDLESANPHWPRTLKFASNAFKSTGTSSAAEDSCASPLEGDGDGADVYGMREFPLVAVAV